MRISLGAMGDVLQRAEAKPFPAGIMVARRIFLFAVLGLSFIGLFIAMAIWGPSLPYLAHPLLQGTRVAGLAVCLGCAAIQGSMLWIVGARVSRDWRDSKVNIQHLFEAAGLLAGLVLIVMWYIRHI